MTTNNHESSISRQNAIDYLISALAIGLTALLFTVMAHQYTRSSSVAPFTTDAPPFAQEYTCENRGMNDQQVLAGAFAKRSDLTATP